MDETEKLILENKSLRKQLDLMNNYHADAVVELAKADNELDDLRAKLDIAIGWFDKIINCQVYPRGDLTRGLHLKNIGRKKH